MEYTFNNGFIIRDYEQYSSSALLKGPYSVEIHQSGIADKIPKRTAFEDVIRKFAEESLENKIDMKIATEPISFLTITPLSEKKYMLSKYGKSQIYEFLSSEDAISGLVDHIDYALKEACVFSDDLEITRDRIIRFYDNDKNSYEQITIKSIVDGAKCIAIYTNQDGISVQTDTIQESDMDLYKVLVEKVKNEEITAEGAFKVAVKQSQEKASQKDTNFEDSCEK